MCSTYSLTHTHSHTRTHTCTLAHLHTCSNEHTHTRTQNRNTHTATNVKTVYCIALVDSLNVSNMVIFIDTYSLCANAIVFECVYKSSDNSSLFFSL